MGKTGTSSDITKGNEKVNAYNLMASSVRRVLMHADTVDLCLMALGLFDAAGGGLYLPAILAVMRNLMNDLGEGPSDPSFIYNINKSSLYFVYLATVSFVASFLGEQRVNAIVRRTWDMLAIRWSFLQKVTVGRGPERGKRRG
ncbi:hypothetical protein HPP92_004311 [Vanilla planifolia]|uniref:Uncharacterized protein n=1 Tax=Vanilla planifolia TaxID=51239 RepID=A0A835RWH1_VANPL|nr:hypothetical protein HPP92_004311 [Vanilla planifolia]